MEVIQVDATQVRFHYVALHDLETIGRNLKDTPEALHSQFSKFLDILDVVQNAGPHIRRYVKLFMGVA